MFLTTSYAAILHVRFCAGAAGDRRSYATNLFTAYEDTEKSLSIVRDTEKPASFTAAFASLRP